MHENQNYKNVRIKDLHMMYTKHHLVCHLLNEYYLNKKNTKEKEIDWKNKENNTVDDD